MTSDLNLSEILNHQMEPSLEAFIDDVMKPRTYDEIIKGCTFECFNYCKHKGYKDEKNKGFKSGDAVMITKTFNLSIIDFDIKKSFDDARKESIRSNILNKLTDDDVVVKTASGGLHVYALMDDFKVQQPRYIKCYEGDEYDVDLFSSVYNKNEDIHVMLPGSKVRLSHKSGKSQTLTYEFIRGNSSSLIKRTVNDVLDSLNLTLTLRSNDNKQKRVRVIHSYEDDEINEMTGDDLMNAKVTNQFDGKDDLITAIIDGFEDLEIHNDARPIEEEITLFTLFQGLNALPSKWVRIAYDTIETTANLTDNAAMNYERKKGLYRHNQTNVYVLMKMLKIHNSEYYNEVILPMIKREHEMKPFDLNDSFVFNDIKQKAENKGYVGKYYELITDLSRVIRFIDTSDGVYIKKIYDCRTGRHKIAYVTPQSMHRQLNEITIERNEKGKKRVTAYDHFVNHKSKFKIDGVKFALPNQSPYGPFYADGIVSIFQGYKYNIIDKENVKMELIDPFLAFIREVIADNDDNVYDYVINWVSFILQHPGVKTETAIVLKGSQGTGKNTFTNVICELMSGYSCKNITDMQAITGQFNTIIENKMMLVLNEVKNAGDDRMANFDTLKSVLSDDSIVINAKGLDHRDADNVANIIMCTNNDYPVKVELTDRRYCILRVNGDHVGDFKYFERLHSLFTNEFYDHLLSYFIHHDIKGFNTRNIPETEARHALRDVNITSFDEWIFEHADELAKGMTRNQILEIKPHDINERQFYLKLSTKTKKVQRRDKGDRYFIYTLTNEWIMKANDRKKKMEEDEKEPVDPNSY